MNQILTIRGRKVILDSELAALYGVATGRFNEAVARRRGKFPPDFMFRLSADELHSLRSQIAISKPGRGGRRYAPYVFTEHGAIMAATILDSPTAREVAVFVVRAFVELRGVMAGQKELIQRLDELEARIEKKLSSHDQAIAETLAAIRILMSSPASKSRPIGFVTPREK
jgi:hypothetical protein